MPILPQVGHCLFILLGRGGAWVLRTLHKQTLGQDEREEEEEEENKGKKKEERRKS